MKIIGSYGTARTKSTKIIALLCVSMITVMLVAQLFKYEDFASVLSVVLPIMSYQAVEILAALLVILELLALPYLLGMYLSPLMRGISALAGGVVSTFWLIAALTSAHASNSALLSTFVQMPGGIMAVLWACALLGLLLSVVIIDTRFRHEASS